MARKMTRRMALVTASTHPEALRPRQYESPRHEPYAWKPEVARHQVAMRPDETWLRYQAQSLLGRPASLQEAQELFAAIDVNTRLPIVPEQPLTWWKELLRL